jgi:hypothetical protein
LSARQDDKAWTKIKIVAGIAVKKGDDNPAANTIVVYFNGEGYLADGVLLEYSIESPD